MNSTRIGDIGVSHIIARCMELDIPVYIPFSDNEKADLIIILNNKPLKVQVKTSNKDSTDTSEFRLYSSTSAIYQRKSIKHCYTPEEVDLFLLYDIPRQQIYCVPFEEKIGDTIVLRHTPTKNNQQKGIKWAKDYIF